MPRPPIRVLPQAVVLKIAAGEVIERPASVVKELVENSIDAGASRVEVRIADGGRGSIAVTDDGHGMSPEEARMAIARHATSKLSDIADLNRLSTLGFRGEALASVAAVSHFDLITRCQEYEVGTHIRMEGGQVRLVEPFGTPPGTTVAAANLFFNVPARKKFLRTRATEAGHVETVLRRLALARVGLEILFEADGETVFHLSTAQDLRERARQLYERAVAEELLSFGVEDGPVRLWGLISCTRLSFARPDEIWLFVNGRAVRDRMLQAAVAEGYRSVLMQRRYPLAVVNVQVSPQMVDVNVHPAKAEVRFADPHFLFRLLADAVASALRGPAPGTTRGAALPAREPATEYGPQARPGAPALAFASPSGAARPAGYPVPADLMPDRGRFASMAHLGSLDNTYLICAAAEALVLIDQHAAHERVQFEKLHAAVSDGRAPEVQSLLVPLTMEVTAARAERLSSLAPLLARLGFGVEPFGPRTFVIKAVPALFGAVDPRPMLADFADEEEWSGGEAAWKDKMGDILSRAACHSAVRAHDRLDPDEVRRLLEEMDRVDLAANCPHGRPTFLRFDLAHLERMFGRR